MGESKGKRVRGASLKPKREDHYVEERGRIKGLWHLNTLYQDREGIWD